jgi:hypothetical protein
MTKKSNQKQTDIRTQLIVYGEDDTGKPRGARFPSTEKESLLPVAEALKFTVLEAQSEELAALGAKLPVGRIYARGKSFIPNIRRDLYDKIHAEAADLPRTDGGTASSAADTATATATLASGLPQDWQSIAAGHMLLVHESPEEGWWEAIVIARENDILTLRYRDFPKVPKFQCHVSTIAMLNPGSN